MIKELYFVTSNKDKVREAEAILGLPIKPVKKDLVEIQSLDLEEIVKKKAEDAFQIVREPVIVDDVGLYVEAWNGFPGPFIRFIYDAGGNELLLRMLQGETNRKVTAKAAIGFQKGREVFTFIGKVKGEIAQGSHGQGGWGWDPIFVPEFTNKTYGELDPIEKNAISHRRAALEKFKEFLQIC
jgi:non-canonical purine NTP pyrophosphatase (RdgB/HAM1 family)